MAALAAVTALSAPAAAQGFDVIFDDGFDGCSGPLRYIYLLDDAARMHRFDPRRLGGPGSAFELIGTLSCPPGAPLPGWLGGTTPYSMSVSRDAVIWVLFTSGEIFHVDPVSVDCSATSFVPGTGGWQLFSMAFAGRAGGAVEPLFIAGGSVDGTDIGDLGWIHPQTLQVTTVGSLESPASAEYAPLLTGVGELELFGFYPSISGASVVQQIDRTTGQLVGPGRQVAGAIGANTVGWAFAHRSGLFWLFLTDADPVSGEPTRRLVSVDRTTGAVAVVGTVPFLAIMAGVSACVPTSAP